MSDENNENIEIKNEEQNETSPQVAEPQKENKPFTINLTFVVVALIIASAYIYVENGKLAYQEKIKAEKEIEQRHQKVAYESCMQEAYNDYIFAWNKNCSRLKKKNDCALPSYNADSIEKVYSDRKKQCMEALKNNAFMDTN